jgi:glucuronosyltransferase
MDEGTAACEAFFTSNHITTLFDLAQQQPFDVLITEFFNTDCVLGLAFKLNITKFVGMSSCALMPWHYERVGLPDTPSYIPSEFVGFSSRMGFTQRLVNWLVVTATKLAYRRSQQLDNERVRKYFGDGIPDVNELAMTTNLLLVNQHFSISGVRPFPPAVIEIGGVHVHETPKSIPDDIRKILDNAEHGVIYVSWGSIISARGMPEAKKRAIVDAFKRLPQVVLWKWENDSITAGASNVHIRGWFPQTDILCHEKVVAFMSHGGMMGVSEAVHCGVPTVVTPIYGDQYLNAAALVERGMGVILGYDEISEARVFESVVEVMKVVYKDAAGRVSEMFKNRQNNPLDTAVYSIERVINTDGSLLKSHAVDLNHFTHHSYDIILLLLLILSSPFFIATKIITLLYKKPKNDKKMKKKKTK